jgi:hypothetical protein
MAPPDRPPEFDPFCDPKPPDADADAEVWVAVPEPIPFDKVSVFNPAVIVVGFPSDPMPTIAVAVMVVLGNITVTNVAGAVSVTVIVVVTPLMTVVIKMIVWGVPFWIIVVG